MLVTGERDLVMIGSQVVDAAVADVPAEVVISRECDLLFDESDPVAGEIDANLGPESRPPDMTGVSSTRT